ncbi:hypothetical protein NKR19_g6362 [Coniochaeta hoffmannii]|uniref:Uncharacterized protein n=1 Tax=Coniochaeta hoffmannii TaxID=91930 RepID=A0AA38RCR3_9PEZI|nr:hypothetical protein NKR19_g6362 [Coniochaeta hoffmannii]
MHLLASLALLAAAVAALPAEPHGEMHFISKRASCQVEFPEGCAAVCCKQAGGCSFLNCASSKCKYLGLDQPYCDCHCHYG